MVNAKQTPINESLDITKTEEYKAFTEAMDEDLNTSKALAILFDLANRANKDEENAYTILYKLLLNIRGAKYIDKNFFELIGSMNSPISILS